MFENIYALTLLIIFILSVLDLMVGVSNDAVNFLSSAVGSKVASYRKIIIISSLGILLGALSSSGMMEIARKGIFNPEMFNFNDIMIIFASVMITDVLLLNFYNSVGLPTSTTVSIVFELFGASFTLAIFKIIEGGENFARVVDYINTSKATVIITGIFSSIIISFIFGSIVQYISRIIFTFNYERRVKKIGAIFSSICITSIVYFVLIKGLKNSSLVDEKIISQYYYYFIILSLVVFYILSNMLIHFTKVNILKVVILIGTFSIAMAFAGNDLVNFIGVSLGGLKAFNEYTASGLEADELYMHVLSGKVKPPTYILILSGIVMIITLWISKKAKRVLNTGINLSDENDNVKENFDSNLLSRSIVRVSIRINEFFLKFIPPKTRINLKNRLKKNSINLPNNKSYERPAFDLIRASINLTLASIIISFATSLKLPLSTTYVTFMVAMGTSLADGAWGRDSAVYRIAGVIKVIVGWFATAFIAFVSCGVIVIAIKYTGFAGILGFTIVIAIILTKKSAKKRSIENINIKSAQSLNDIITETQSNFANFFKEINQNYSKSIEGGIFEKRTLLKNSLKFLKETTNNVEDLKKSIFYTLKTLNNVSIDSGKIYVIMIDRERRILRYTNRISENIYYHVDNNLKSFSKNQIKTLKEVNSEMNNIFDIINNIIENKAFNNISKFENINNELKIYISNKIDEKLAKVHKENDFSHKNTELYISILLDTKEMLSFTEEAIKSYKNFWISVYGRKQS